MGARECRLVVAGQRMAGMEAGVDSPDRLIARFGDGSRRGVLARTPIGSDRALFRVASFFDGTRTLVLYV